MSKLQEFFDHPTIAGLYEAAEELGAPKHAPARKSWSERRAGPSLKDVLSALGADVTTLRKLSGAKPIQDRHLYTNPMQEGSADRPSPMDFFQPSVPDLLDLEFYTEEAALERRKRIEDRIEVNAERARLVDEHIERERGKTYTFEPTPEALELQRQREEEIKRIEALWDERDNKNGVFERADKPVFNDDFSMTSNYYRFDDD